MISDRFIVQTGAVSNQARLERSGRTARRRNDRCVKLECLYYITLQTLFHSKQTYKPDSVSAEAERSSFILDPCYQEPRATLPHTNQTYLKYIPFQWHLPKKECIQTNITCALRAKPDWCRDTVLLPGKDLAVSLRTSLSGFTLIAQGAPIFRWKASLFAPRRSPETGVTRYPSPRSPRRFCGVKVRTFLPHTPIELCTQVLVSSGMQT